MKTLVIGMDGAQYATFKRGWTPFLESMIEEGSAQPLKEDLISRGWAEVFTGAHAKETGAMYERPLMDGTHRWTDKLSIGDLVGLGKEIKPIWQVLNEAGYRVGVMNVPTTFPAPNVDGFFVSGGGGGSSINQGLAQEHGFPASVADELNERGYILDERLPSLLDEKGLYAPHDFFTRLYEMNEKRTNSFLYLAQAHTVDFGFVVYKSSVVTTETLLLPELNRKERGEPINGEFVAAAEQFYRSFDEQVRRLVEAFPNAEVLLVSDHGMAPRQWSVNPNALLRELGFQKASASRRGLFDVVQAGKQWVPSVIRRRLKASPRIKAAYRSIISFDPKRSQAFNITLINAIHGVYVNDEHRFGGPVSDNEFEKVRNRVVDAFNGHPDSQRHGIVARADHGSGTWAQRQYPDVVLDLPDGYAPSNVWPAYIEPYVAGDQPIDLIEMQKDRRLSCKAHWPIAVLCGGEWLVSSSEEKNDLRLVYDHIVTRFTH